MEDAIQMANEAERVMAGREYTVVSHQVLQLADRSGCAAYDCELVALARDLEVPLVTTDRELLRAFPAVAVAPGTFAG